MVRLDIANLLSESLERWGGRALGLAVICFALSAPLAIFEETATSPAVELGVNLGQLGVATFIFGATCLHLGNAGASLSESFGEAFRNLPALLGIGLLATVGIILGLVLLVVPGLIIGAIATLVVPFYLVEECSFGTAIRRAFEAGSDDLLRLTGAFALAALGYLVLAGGLVVGTSLLLSGSTSPDGLTVSTGAVTLVAEVCSAVQSTYFASFGLVAYEHLTSGDDMAVEGPW